MSNIIPFNYESKKVQIIQDENGELWWIAKEVCSVLEISDVSQAVERLDEDEKLLRTLYVSGQNRDVWSVNQPGLYSLILRSNKPESKKFKRWITHEVLPSIQKTGKYEIEGVSQIDLIIQSAQALKQIEQEQRIHVLEAKSHQNSGHTGYWTITAWCKLNNLNISLNDAMHIGKKATKLSKDLNAETGKVSDERFGEVNSYREDILEEVFGSIGDKAA